MSSLRLINFLKEKVVELHNAREYAEERIRDLTKELTDLQESKPKKKRTYLTPLQMKEIFYRGNASGEKQDIVAKKYGVGCTIIGKIHKLRKNYEDGLIPLPAWAVNE
jgi:hypothetical protein